MTDKKAAGQEVVPVADPNGEPSEANQEAAGQEVVPVADPNGEPLDAQREFLREAVRLEDRRLDLARERTEVVARSQELSNEQDERQADYAHEVLASEERADIRRHSLASRVTIGGGLVAVGYFGSLMALTFFGTGEQSELALKLLELTLTGLGGFGIGYVLLAAFRRLLQSR